MTPSENCLQVLLILLTPKCIPEIFLYPKQPKESEAKVDVAWFSYLSLGD